MDHWTYRARRRANRRDAAARRDYRQTRWPLGWT